MISSTINITIWIGFAALLYRSFKSFNNSIAKDPFGEYHEPQFVSSLGVFGTFLGITIGLFFFESNDLQKSIPTLLNGMKTAFLTSILGMASSMVMKMNQRNKKHAARTDNNAKVIEGATIDDVLSQLIESHNTQKEYNKLTLELMSANNDLLQNTIRESLMKMTDSLVGDGESTLVGQMKFFRSDMNDSQKSLKEELRKGNDALIIEFKTFAQQMAENNCKAFIEALNETMKDFNNKLQEQFGENFKQLNIAVGRLLEWQEAYKDTIIEVTENQKVIFLGIGHAKQALEEMALTSSAIQGSAERISNMIVTTATYHQLIEKSLANLTEISKQAQEFIPSINAMMENVKLELISNNSLLRKNAEETLSLTYNNFTDSTSKINELNSSTNQRLTEIFNKSNNASIETNELLKLNANKITETAELALNKITNHNINSIDSLNAFSDDLNDTLTKQSEKISSTIIKIDSAAQEITNSVSNNIHSILEENSELLKKINEESFKKIDLTHQKNLTVLGKNLLSITTAFTDDYRALIKQMTMLVEIAKKIK